MPSRLIPLIVAAIAFAPSLVRALGDKDQVRDVQPPPQAQAETSTRPDTQRKVIVVVGGSTGLGISYLPLVIMKEDKLLEKRAAALGLDASMQWRPYPVAADMYDALVSGKIDFASGGVTQLLTSWDRTRADLRIKGVGTLNEMPLDLITSNPEVRTIADFTSKDRIALPAVRTSIQAVVLSMAAEKAFGSGQAGRLDPLTVALGHPEAMANVTGGKSDVDAHFSSPPFEYEELARPGVHTVLDSYTVLGGPHTYNLVWATTKFHDANPKIVAAFVSALQDAFDRIKSDPAAAAALWLKSENVRNMSVAQVEEIIRKPGIAWTMTPRKIMHFASFMSQIGLISIQPTDLHALFFDSIKNGD